MGVCQGRKKNLAYKQSISLDKIEYDIEKNLFLEVRAKANKLQFSKNEINYFPVMITLRTLDQVQNDQANGQNEIGQNQVGNINQKLNFKIIQNRPMSILNRTSRIDLICVIDHSGSMGGEKIQLVKKTLLFVVKLLSETDRLCLIQFDDKCEILCNLMEMTKDNKEKIINDIKKIESCGETDISLGMNCAFDVLKQRTEENMITSIFLLSDGLDSGAEIKIARSRQNNYSILNEKSFTIHTFGFGDDHDPKLMVSIANLQNGNFYYIENLSRLDESFINALGALFSVIAQNIEITVMIQKNDLNLKCIKTFGHMWKVIEDQIYQINMSQLISGVTKDFLMLFELPTFQGVQISQLNREQQILKVELRCEQNGKQYKMNQTLSVQFFNPDEEMGEVDIDGEVMENFCRVQTALAIENAMHNLDKGNYNEGQSLLDQAIAQVENIQQMKNVNSQNLEQFKKDLLQSKEQCDPPNYKKMGARNMIMFNNCHITQQCKAQNSKNHLNFDLQYQNRLQIQINQLMQMEWKQEQQSEQEQEQKEFV